MKKLISLLLMVCACLFAGILLTACDGEGDPTHTHTYGEWVEVNAPTCVAKGKREKTCACGDKVTEEIETVAHTEEALPAKAMTCTEDGLTEGKKCTVCGTVTVAQTVIPAKHTEETLPAKAMTCTEDGLTEGKKCTVCGTVTVAQTVIPAKHSEETLPAKAMTCTEDGLTEGKKCTVCGTVTLEQTVIPAKHSEETLPAKAMTCTEDGLTEGKKCTVCGTVTVAQTVIPAKHSEETLPGKAATCMATGLTEGKKCSVCGTVTVKQEELPLEKHVYATEWSKDEENHWHACTTVGCTAAADGTAHTWNAGEVTVKPGEQTAGEKLLTCTACAATKKEELPPIGNSKVADAAAWDAAVTYSGNYVHTIDMYWEEEGELLYAGRQIQIRYGNIIKIDNDDYFTKEGDKYYAYSLHVRTDDGGETFYEQWERKETSSFYFDMLAANFSSLQGLFSSFVYNEEDGWYYGDDVTVQGGKMDIKLKIENGRVVRLITDGIGFGERQVTEYFVEYKDVQLTPPTLEKKPHTHVHGYWKDSGDGVHHVSVCGYCDSVMEQKEAHVWDETNTICTGCRLSKKEQTEE